MATQPDNYAALWGGSVAFETVTPQEFLTNNLSDRYVPVGWLMPPIHTAVIATPYVGPMTGNPIPVSYVRATADARPHGPIGLATPNVSILPTNDKVAVTTNNG